MSLDLSPAPGAAPLTRQVRAQASMEVRLLLRNGEQLLLAVVIPVLVLIGGVVGAERVGLDLAHQPVDELTPGVLALAILSTSFTSLAIATGFERRYGVLKRLGATPLPRSGLLAAKVLALLVVEVLQVVVLAGVALALGWSPSPGVVGLLGFVLAAVLGTAAFASLGLLIAGTLRAEATLAVANLVYLLLLAGGAVVLPTLVVRRVRRRRALAALGGARGRRTSGVPRRRDRLVPRSRACWSGRPSAASSPRGRSGGSDRDLLAVAAAAGVGDAGRQRRARGDGRRRAPDRLGPRLPDLAALHRDVLHPPRRARRPRRDRVRQPDADLRAGRHRRGHVRRGLGQPAARRAGRWPSSWRWASPRRPSSAGSPCSPTSTRGWCPSTCCARWRSSACRCCSCTGSRPPGAVDVVAARPSCSPG